MITIELSGKKALSEWQTRKLIELGVPSEKGTRILDTDYFPPRDKITFFIGDLLDLLPRDIGLEVNNKYGVERGTLCCRLTITSKYIVSYECTMLDYKARETIVEFNDSNLIDSLYCMVVWCIENGHISTII